MSHVIVVFSDDLQAKKAVHRVAAEFNCVVVDSASSSPEGVVAVVTELSGDLDPVEFVKMVRSQWPMVLICGFLAKVDKDVWTRAERSGFDMVVTKGSLVPTLRGKLRRSFEGGERRKFAICESSAIAGRLGLVAQMEDSPFGDLALWRVGGSLACLVDRCPHAGARLSEGEVEEGIVTCPAHGSRFELLSGERVRGPADTDALRLDVVEENGRVWVVERL